LSAGRDVARAIDALRRGWPVRIDGTAFLAVETADDETLAEFDRGAAAALLISGRRAETLKITNQIAAAAGAVVQIARTLDFDLKQALAVADPALDLARPMKGPFRAAPVDQPGTSCAAIRLARRAGLLPALFAGGQADEEAVSLSSKLVEGEELSPRLRIVSRAKLPTRFAEQGEIVAFRAEDDGSEHVALLIGAPSGEPALVRLHSECLTGDVLGSLKCDCGAQLAGALEAIAASGWGILLYLRQEGRGIGLVNKLRAYALQDQGFDTVDANLRLGFADDERSFAVAAAMLSRLAQDRVRLLTNNPRKVEGLEAAGIEVVERVPLAVAANRHNLRYLETKKRRSGHRL
jgi:GTP cyclohydrolase II